MSASRRYRIHANPFNLREPIIPPAWAALFGRSAPIAVDIGCGQGAFTVELARRHPEWNVVGVEMRDHFVDGLNVLALSQGVPNLRAVLANANLHLDALFPPRSITWVSINFPDPWYKKRHHKRRVVQSEWLRVLSDKLLPGAEIHAATDYRELAVEMQARLTATPGFVPVVSGFAPESTTGILTERERKHLERGEPIYRLRFRFAVACPAANMSSP